MVTVTTEASLSRLLQSQACSADTEPTPLLSQSDSDLGGWDSESEPSRLRAAREPRSQVGIDNAIVP